MTAHFGGIKLNISVYFCAIIMFLCIFAPDGSAPAGLFCCLAHEAGHLVFIRIFGEKVRSVSFGVYGMRIETSSALNVSHIKEAVISFAGPAVNIALIIIGLILKSSRLVNVNAALALVNLMPAGRTDGWNILYNLLIFFHGEDTTQRVLNIIGAVFLFVMYLIGAVVFLNSGYNFTLLAVAAYITVIFIFR